MKELEAELAAVISERNRIALVLADLIDEHIRMRRASQEEGSSISQWSEDFEKRFTEARAELANVMRKFEEIEAKLAHASGLSFKKIEIV